VPSIFTLQGPSFGYANGAAAPSRGNLSSVLVLGGGDNVFGQFGAAGETTSINPAGGTMTVNGQLFQVGSPQGPFVDSTTWLGKRPPSLSEQALIGSFKNTWAALGKACVQQGVGCAVGAVSGPYLKSNFTVPTAFQNFYRDAAIEKLYNPDTGEVLIIKNDPSWLASKLNDVLKYCNYGVVAAGVGGGPAAAGAATAGCALLTSGTPPSGSNTPAGTQLTPKKMSTGAKVALGVGGAGVLGAIVYGISRFLK
jgi:hypothetical protein